MPSVPDDPVRHLFDALPEPQTYHMGVRPVIEKGSHDQRLLPHLRFFVQQCASAEDFKDPDGQYLYEHATKAIELQKSPSPPCDSIFLLGLGVLAYKAGRPPPISLGKSKKDRYLRYAAWILRGRRDEEYPFGPPLSTAPLPDQYAKLPIHVTSSNWECAHCSQPDAKLRCEECFVEESGLLAIFYCSLSCQQAHLVHHSELCHSRRDIGRAASILKSLSKLLQEKIYFGRLKTFRVNNSIITFEDYSLAGHESDHDPRIFWGDFIFPQPPYDLIQAEVGASAAKDYFMAIVYHQLAMELHAYELPFIQIFLDPVCKLIEEITITPKNAALTMVRTWSGLQCLSSVLGNHVLLRAQGDSGEQFAIDLAGAQYGWKDCFSLWKHYEAHRAHSVDFIVEEGSHKDLMKTVLPLQDMLSGNGPGVTVPTSVMHIRSQLIDTTADHTIKSWLKSKGMEDVRKLYALPREIFDDRKSKLLQHVGGTHDSALDILRKQGSHRLYFLKDFQIRVATTPKLTERYQSVWLTEEEVEEMSDKPEELRAAWIRNLRTANHLYLE